MVYMLEPNASNKLTDAEVLAKKAVAEQWCRAASEHATRHGAKPWKYALLPHDKIPLHIMPKRMVKKFG